MAFNLPAALEKFADIAEAMGEWIDGLPDREAAYLALEAVEALLRMRHFRVACSNLVLKKKILRHWLMCVERSRTFEEQSPQGHQRRYDRDLRASFLIPISLSTLRS